MSSGMDRPLARPWWKKKPAIFGAAVAATAVAAALGAVALSGASARTLRVPAANVTIDTATQSVFHDFTPLQGKVTPKDTLYLDALEGGQVQEILAQAGDRVAKGQPLVRFKNTSVELAVLNQAAIAAQSLTQTQSFQTQLEATHAANERALNQIDYDITRLRRARIWIMLSCRPEMVLRMLGSCARRRTSWALLVSAWTGRCLRSKLSSSWY